VSAVSSEKQQTWRACFAAIMAHRGLPCRMMVIEGSTVTSQFGCVIGSI
jgi:hypothetical protein